MKKLIVIAIALAAPIFVQGQSKAAQKQIDKQMAMWTEQCDLSTDQTAALQMLISEKTEALVANRKANRGAKEKLQAAAKEINQKYAGKLRALVGRDNVRKMNAYRRSQRENS
ncbi:MAG: hypothetical protein MKZ70_10780 [Opitutales bacterium]|nr:hypothetical protein [Opitutales bacterium]